MFQKGRSVCSCELLLIFELQFNRIEEVLISHVFPSDLLSYFSHMLASSGLAASGHVRENMSV